MNKGLINKLVRETNIKKSDCDRLTNLADLISSRSNKPLEKIITPLTILSSLNYTYNDIKLLKTILDSINVQYSYDICNDNFFEKLPFEPRFYSKEEESHLSTCVILRCNGHGFFFKDGVENILVDLKKLIPEKSEAILLFLDDNGLSREIDGEKLEYHIKINSNRYELLRTILKHKTKTKDLKLSGKKKPPSICREVNTVAQKKLRLPKKFKLIVNDRDDEGYYINHKYSITCL